MKYLKFLLSPVFMGVLFVVFALAMAVATFLENDFGSAAAYSMVYNTRWFELILLLLAVNLVGQLILFKLFRASRITGALFHLAFIIMLAGAAITRYFGWEGSIHIREGEEQNQCMSGEKFISYSIKDNTGNILASGSEKYTLTNVSADNFRKKIKANGKNYEINLSKIIPNASFSVKDVPSGNALVSLFVSKDDMQGDNVILRKGDIKVSNGITLGFESEQPADLNIKSDSGKFFVTAVSGLGEMSMMSHGITSIAPGERVLMKEMQVLTLNGAKVVPQLMSLSAVAEPVYVDPKEQTTGQNAFIFEVKGDNSGTIYVWDNQSEGASSSSALIGDATVEISYGSKAVTLPFSIKLNDFILERYPGSSSPSGYKSDVVLIDNTAGVKKPYMIFMNNILKYKGYRFYQSSFDRDEKGTVLSVNHDFTGMFVTYTGYAILFLFIILSLLNKKSVFHNINAGHWRSNLRKTSVIILLALLSGTASLNAQKFVPDKTAATEFGKVLVQDQKGRTKPLFTLSNDILRKVTRENKFEGMTSMQVFLGLYLDFDNWKNVPLINVSNKEIRSKVGISDNYASFSDLVDLQNGGTYKISGDVDKAYSKAPGERTKYDKEVMKVDERLNIIYMIYNGDFMKLFPLKDGSHNWGSANEALAHATTHEDSLYTKSIIPVLADAIRANNVSQVKKIASSISGYQKNFAGYDLPSDSKTKAELLYYRMNIFEKLFPFYATIGLVMLIGLITMVIKGRKEKSLFVKIAGWLLFAGFLFHTFGLALRWYIAGHSPMSNGYESMIFISWVTLLAGFIFSRKSAFTLSATGVLASMTLMVAHLSFMDPEITNLVPVLKSYWLTLHVSVITGSYGFLGLGAILGIITLILLSFSGKNNRDRISSTIDELTVINYKTLTLGLYFLTIGTFLGAVWANESWGRYWGWDPKETWSLITIVIYSIVVHSRIIPGMKDVYTFNLLSLVAFSSVLMTYFGVNYYLSGLHSYAAGDSIPVPSFVYITVVVLGALAFYAHSKYQRFSEKD
jgi:cytochrome c-type biogenesis protein CcsB